MKVKFKIKERENEIKIKERKKEEIKDTEKDRQIDIYNLHNVHIFTPHKISSQPKHQRTNGIDQFV